VDGGTKLRTNGKSYQSTRSNIPDGLILYLFNYFKIWAYCFRPKMFRL
jgi:hypothetical protein